MDARASHPIPPLVAVLHSNKLELLCDLLIAWMRRHPLDPLEDEVVLVQSKGMGLWLKQALASGHHRGGGAAPDASLGVSAALRVELPSAFIWRAYSAVLGEDVVREQQPLRKDAMVWRIFRLLPELLQEPAYRPLARYLRDDDQARKRHQLAETLADVLDGYQVYRADWLRDWAQGRDHLLDAHGRPFPLDGEEGWQPALWRRLLADVIEHDAVGHAKSDRSDLAATDALSWLDCSSRPAVHQRFLDRLSQSPPRPEGLPRRVVVFGCSSLPQQIVEALHALGRVSQVLLCVHNPCRHHWPDVIDPRHALRRHFQRQAFKSVAHEQPSVSDLHRLVNPLLAAWGRQGRDFLDMLDRFDDPAQYHTGVLQGERVDLFESYGSDASAAAAPKSRSLLEQVQQAVLDLEPLPGPGAPRTRIDRDDASICFHVAHSPLREIEVLHDQLLHLFAKGAREGRPPLRPRDIVVMVPDIDVYAPYIEAVFGQHERLPDSVDASHDIDDARAIPYSISDQRERSSDRLLVGLDALLRVSETRLAASEVLSLLDVPALRQRFGFEEADVDSLSRLIADSGIRWGLDGAHRAELTDMPTDLRVTTWEMGLQRMMLGYAVGTLPHDATPIAPVFAAAGVEPLADMSRDDAPLAGRLARLIRALHDLRSELRVDGTMEAWTKCFARLLETFFVPVSDAERVVVQRLNAQLQQLDALAAETALTETVPVAIAREAWLGAVEAAGGARRFLGGRVTFATLMPMRAIPFRVVCLLGLDDVSFPREQAAQGFDLLGRSAGGTRPGDRSRRVDDQYLFLEALLSAREVLYISWVGRSIRDDAEGPASVLVEQLRDYLQSGWSVGEGDADVLAHLTWEHPLQPFSPRYFEGDSRWTSFAREWREARNGAPASGPETGAQRLPAPAALTLTLSDAERLLKSPVRPFFTTALGVYFDEIDEVRDIESFALDGLGRFQVGTRLLEALQRGAGPHAAAEAVHAAFASVRARALREGALPLAAFGEHAFDMIAREIELAWNRWQRAVSALQSWACGPLEVRADFTLRYKDATTPVPVRFEGQVPGYARRTSQGAMVAWAAVELVPRALLEPKSRNKPRHRALTAEWVRHLAACAAVPAGVSCVTWVAGADATVRFGHVEEARRHLEALVCAYAMGLREPLRLGRSAGFTWLDKREKVAKDAESVHDAFLDACAPEGAVAKAYGDSDVAYDPCLQRAFPSIDALIEHDGDPLACEGEHARCTNVFLALVDALYQPLRSHVGIEGGE